MNSHCVNCYEEGDLKCEQCFNFYCIDCEMDECYVCGEDICKECSGTTGKNFLEYDDRDVLCINCSNHSDVDYARSIHKHSLEPFFIRTNPESDMSPYEKMVQAFKKHMSKKFD